MTKELTLILGGARSGKTTYAESLARAAQGTVLYVATATAGDEEMATRITTHRAQRPPGWRTLEVARQVGMAVRAYRPLPDLVLLDCMTLLANNVCGSLPEPVDEATFQGDMNREVDEMIATWRAGDASWIVVSNEVGLGLVPPYPLGRVYRDVLGRANQRLAAAATRVLLIVAGIPMVVKAPG
jgi:adenosylcobinamide kinase/adenosylcobinamide-phosphate guanylyltransferase